MQICFAVDRPALESDLMASRQKGLLPYLVPFGFSKSIKVPEITKFCPALCMGISWDDKASHALSGTYCI